MKQTGRNTCIISSGCDGWLERRHPPLDTTPDKWLNWNINKLLIISQHIHKCRSQWPRGLRCRSTAARLLRLWVRFPPGAWKFVCCECYVLSGRGLCDELITSPEESYRLWCVIVGDLETSRMRRPWPALGRSATGIKAQICCVNLY